MFERLRALDVARRSFRGREKEIAGLVIFVVDRAREPFECFAAEPDHAVSIAKKCFAVPHARARVLGKPREGVLRIVAAFDSGVEVFEYRRALVSAEAKTERSAAHVDA